ncbi:MAG: cellulose synthase operon protein YhjQ/BcsQ [Bryobacteraceae bacterium]
MTEKAPDDIFALYSRFDLDGDNYRVFRSEEVDKGPVTAVPVTTASVPAEEREEPSKPVLVETKCNKVDLVKESTFLPAESVATPHRIPTPIRLEADASRASLQGLWRHVANARTTTFRSTPETLAANSVSVTGVAGGVGATTIAAILARLLAKTGRRCALFDDTEDPTLPIYFGAQRVADEQRRFAGLRSIFESRARVVNRRMFEPVEASDTSATFIERNFALIAEHFDHLVFDRPGRSCDSSGAALRIYVAIPDLSSLTRIQKVRRELDLVGDTGSTVCVLNRFDSSISLHVEILGWYRENFRNLIVIRESSLVPEALAEGSTVVDWIPDSAVSGDFLNLFATVSQLQGAQTERLPLCS